MEQTAYHPLEPINSVLKLSNVVFDKILFERVGFHNPKTNVQPEFNMAYQMEELPHCTYRITILAQAVKKAEYTATVQISGFFQIESCNLDETSKQIFFEENAVAILFPYIRSEMTLLTTQPEVDPIVLPVMNIAQMIKQSKHTKNHD